MKQTVFEREESERRERERVRKARESWRMTPRDLEEEREELRQQRAARRKAKQAAKGSENAGVAERKMERNPGGGPPPGEGEELAQRAVQEFNGQGSAPANSPSKDGKGDEKAAKDAGGVWQPSVLEERESHPAEEAENRLTPLNAA